MAATFGDGPITQRGPVGGTTTVVLGCESAKDIFDNREQSHPPLQSLEAAPRFPQAPGGTSTIPLGSGAANTEVNDDDGFTRGPVGGETTICLGSEDSRAIFNKFECERDVDVETPDAAPRFPQAPGGDAQVCLGGAPPCCVTVRGAVGGEATVSLGSESASEFFMKRQQERDMAVVTPEALSRFPQAPGGVSSVCFGAAGGHAVACRGPVGGESTISFGCDESDGVEIAPIETRGPVGGVVSVSLGSDNFAEFLHRRDAEHRHSLETPEAVPRFTQAPGGNSTVPLGSAAEDDSTLSPTPVTRRPVGGTDTLCLGADDGTTQVSEPGIAPRGPVGGATTIVLGGDDSGELLLEMERQRKAAPTATPAAVPRFPQAPGGDSTFSFSAGEAEVHSTAMRPIGGTTTVVLGTEDHRTLLQEQQQLRDTLVDTPAAAPRFQQAPGGTSTLTFDESISNVGACGGGASEKAAACPIGGPVTLVLGADDNAEIFRARQAQRNAELETPVACVRFKQAPGGDATVLLGDERGIAEVMSQATGGPVGGVSTIQLGLDDAAATYQELDAQRNLYVETPAAPPRFPQAPGGTSTQPLHGGPEHASTSVQFGPPIGGTATVVLGADDPKEVFSVRQAHREMKFDTPAAAARFSQAPGGAATVVLGGAVAEEPRVQHSYTAGGASTLVLGGNYPHDIAQKTSSNCFANGANQNCGNVITDRPSTRLHYAPGGASTLRLGDEEPADRSVKVSQVKPRGDVESDAPIVRVRQAPGGSSTLALGGGYPEATERPSASRFANGTNQNCGNTITGRSTTRVHHAPGGVSTVCLGTCDENVDTSNIAAVNASQKKVGEEKPAAGLVGGSAPIILLG